jgi:nucleoside-diphosphate-sugar epimerase
VRRVLVTHVDSGLGRRLVKALYHDPDVSLVLGTGTGPAPSYLEAYSEKCAYQRLDLAKSRHVVSFFNSVRFARARLDSVIHLPSAGTAGARIPGNVPQLVSETRRLLEACKETRGQIARFVYLSSAFVYRPEPGNANVVSEETLLDLESEVDAETRAWIDADMICQRELNDRTMRVTILRAAAIVADGGSFLQSPPLERGESPAGFDPMFSVISDRDVARALVLALHGEVSGTFNIAGNEVFPRSELVPHHSRIGPIPVPGVVRGALSLLDQALGLRLEGATPFHRYGIVLDTRQSAEQLGFEPQYRVEVRRQGGERRVEAVRYR